MSSPVAGTAVELLLYRLARERWLPSTYLPDRLSPKIDYLSSRNRLISRLKYYFFFIGETKAILVSEISGSKKRWGNRNSCTAYLHTSYCLSLRPLRGTGNKQFTVIINHRNHTTRVLCGPFLYLEGRFHLLNFWGGKQRLRSFTQYIYM